MRVFVTVGTDHHPFARLLAWVERWAVTHPGDIVVVQHGAGAAPRSCVDHELLPVERLQAELAAADVVVCSAGPGAAMDARDQGRLPVVVPRLAGLGEAVDDHQVAFARHLAEHGLARCVEREEELAAVLEEARDHPGVFAPGVQERPVPEGVRRVGCLVDELVWGP